MILYKYTPYDSGRKIISGNSIGFASPESFNDPFEVTGYPREMAPDPISRAFADIRSYVKRHAWLQAAAVLSLTRSPLNPLMWAHYADAHRGFVIGFDVHKCGFTSTDTNLLPAQYGSVIYTQNRPTFDLVSTSLMEVGREFSYRPDLLEKLQRLFLYKPLCWSYEEEVRVVKCVAGIEQERRLPSGTFTVVSGRHADLYTLPVPEGAITDVFLGMRTPLAPRAEWLTFQAELLERHPRARLRRCVVSTEEWTIEDEDAADLR